VTEESAWPEWFDGLGGALRGMGPGMQPLVYGAESVGPHPMEPLDPIGDVEIPMSPAGWEEDDE